MPGLSASELPPEALCAGDSVEYYSRAFVTGDPRGHRRAVVTRIDGDEDTQFPVDVDTGEVVPRDMMVKRVADRMCHPPQAGDSLWRKLRTFELVPGTFSAPTRASALNQALAGAVKAAVEAVREAVEDSRDETVPETPQSSVCSSPESGVSLDHVQLPSTPSSNVSATSTPGGPLDTSPTKATNEGSIQSSIIRQTIDLVSSGDDTDKQPGADADEPGSGADREVAAYMRAIPNRHARAKIQHQAKTKRVQWHVPRSRKRRHLSKCAITKSGSEIYHAKPFKAVKFKALQNSPEVKEQIESLRARRTSYPDASAKETRMLCRTVAWPAGIEKITTCKANGVKFNDIGSFDPCKCFGDCFWDTCSNVASASFCTRRYCRLGAKCSNAPRTLSTLQLYDTGRVGLGVNSTTDLDVGDVLGEYCGELTEFPAVVEGQPPQALKMNSGFTLLYNAKSVNGNYVYVDALKCGSITRFLSHSCNPNAAFVQPECSVRGAADAHSRSSAGEDDQDRSRWRPDYRALRQRALV